MDPLFNDGVDLAVVLIVVFKTVAVFAFLLVCTMLMIWFERKLISDMQNRIGPNRAGPWGIGQTMADGVKLFFKEGLLPDRSDRTIFRLAPYLAMVPAFVTFAIVPIGGDFSRGNNGIISLFGHDTFLQLADPPVGILVALACSSIAVYGVMLAGWSSGSKYPLLGAVRASGQMVSYEAALGLSVVTVVLATGAGLSTHAIVAAQMADKWTLLTSGVVPFGIFFLAATAELERPPFDLLEAEQELVAGFNTEYAGIRFALFYIAGFMNPITMSALITTLFLGGPSGPAPIGPVWMWSLVWWFLKVIALLFVFVWMRATLPRFRYDQLMDLGWKVLIPLSLAWLLIVAALRVGTDEGWNMFVVLGVCTVVLLACGGMLSLASRMGAERRQLGELEG